MAENRIKIVSVEPEKEPIIEHIKNSINDFRDTLGDHINIVALDDNISIVMDSKYNDNTMTANRKLGDVYIGGEFFLVNNNGNNEFGSLSDEQIHKCMEWFEEIPKWSGAQIATAKEYDKSENNMFLESQVLQDKYIYRINKDLLPNINYPQLSASYNTDDMKYAKEVLRQLHEVFVEIYGTSSLDNSYEFVTMPAVIKSSNTNDICIGLIDVDVSSSGEHWSTAFFTEKGVTQPFEPKKEDNSKEILKHFMPYEYFYTPTAQGDIHISDFKKTEAITSLLDYAVSKNAETLDTNTDTESSDEDMEEI